MEVKKLWKNHHQQRNNRSPHAIQFNYLREDKIKLCKAKPTQLSSRDKGVFFFFNTQISLMSEIYKKWLEPKPKELQKQPPIGQKRSKIV